MKFNRLMGGQHHFQFVTVDAFIRFVNHGFPLFLTMLEECAQSCGLLSDWDDVAGVNNIARSDGKAVVNIAELERALLPEPDAYRTSFAVGWKWAGRKKDRSTPGFGLIRLSPRASKVRGIANLSLPNFEDAPALFSQECIHELYSTGNDGPIGLNSDLSLIPETGPPGRPFSFYHVSRGFDFGRMTYDPEHDQNKRMKEGEYICPSEILKRLDEEGRS